MADKDPRTEIEGLRAAIRAGERDIDDERGREVLIEFSNQLDLLASQYSDHRHIKLLRHCTRMAEHAGGLADALEDRDAAERIVRWINRTYDNEETNRDYRSAIRVFGKRTLRQDEPPESLAWVPTGTSRDYDPVPSTADMLDWDPDILAMLDACRNPRDEACIAVQFDGGFRSGELYEMRVGDVFDGEYAMGVLVDGKTGEREVHLIKSVPYLQRWLSDHPAGDDPDAALWTKLRDPEQQGYRPWLRNFKLPAERAGIGKPATPTNLRKSNMRWLVQLGMEQPRIEDRQGRKRGSDATARYMARFGSASNEKRYAELHGRDVGESADDPEGPIECPRCDRETPRHLEFCMWCHGALSFEATEKLESVVDGGVEEMVDADDATLRQLFGEFVTFVRDRPHTLPEDDHGGSPPEPSSSP